MFRLHVEDCTYLELRLSPGIGTPPESLVSELGDRLMRVPVRLESHLAEVNPSPYWRRVAFRFPSMVRFLVDQTRVGVESSHAIANAVLPEVAAHNLVFGTEMVLASATTSTEPVATVVRPEASTLRELLKLPISLRFDQDSLEFAAQNIVAEAKSTYPNLPFDFRVRILGEDLKLDGITRNQQIRDFVQEDVPLEEVLTALVMKANPVTTVTSPMESDQKLLWVIGPDPEEPAMECVLITTRQVAQRNYAIPSVFGASP
jgi:hypothetical protein